MRVLNTASGDLVKACKMAEGIRDEKHVARWKHCHQVPRVHQVEELAAGCLPWLGKLSVPVLGGLSSPVWLKALPSVPSTVFGCIAKECRQLWCCNFCSKVCPTVGVIAGACIPTTKTWVWKGQAKSFALTHGRARSFTHLAGCAAALGIP